MKYTRQITIRHFKDTSSKNIVLIPLQKYNCVMEEDDFKELQHLGINFPWSYKQFACWGRNRGRYINLARVLCDCQKGQCVRYVDRNPLNLRRSNLVVTEGMSKFRARDKLRRCLPARDYQQIHIYEQKDFNTDEKDKQFAKSQ
jgi:hypothetical protein